MNKAFEKILDRLEEERELSYADFSRYVEEVSPCLDDEYDDFFHRGLERASRLVKEVAEEYNGGWIPCSERLPEAGKRYLVSAIWKDKDFEKSAVYDAVYGSDGLWHSYNYEPVSYKVIAWQPLPEPFKERD